MQKKTNPLIENIKKERQSQKNLLQKIHEQRNKDFCKQANAQYPKSNYQNSEINQKQYGEYRKNHQVNRKSKDNNSKSTKSIIQQLYGERQNQFKKKTNKSSRSKSKDFIHIKKQINLSPYKTSPLKVNPYLQKNPSQQLSRSKTKNQKNQKTTCLNKQKKKDFQSIQTFSFQYPKLLKYQTQRAFYTKKENEDMQINFKNQHRLDDDCVSEKNIQSRKQLTLNLQKTNSNQDKNVLQIDCNSKKQSQTLKEHQIVSIYYLKYISELQKRNKDYEQAILKLKQQLNYKDYLLDQCQKEICHLRQTYQLMLSMNQINKKKQHNFVNGFDHIQINKSQKDINKQTQIYYHKIPQKIDLNQIQKCRKQVQKSSSEMTQNERIQNEKQGKQNNFQTFIKNVNTQEINEKQSQIQYSQSAILSEQHSSRHKKSRNIQIEESSFEITNSSIDQKQNLNKKKDKQCFSIQQQNYINLKSQTQLKKSQEPNNTNKKIVQTQINRQKIEQSQQNYQHLQIIQNQESDQQQLVLKAKDQIKSAKKDIKALKQRINLVMQKHNKFQRCKFKNLQEQKGKQNQEKLIKWVNENIRVQKNEGYFLTKNINQINKQNNVLYSEKEFQKCGIIRNKLQKAEKYRAINSRTVVTSVHRLWRNGDSKHNKQETI